MQNNRPDANYAAAISFQYLEKEEQSGGHIGSGILCSFSLIMLFVTQM